MDIRIIKNEVLSPKVGDIIEFESRDDSGFYIICQNNTESDGKSEFFLINVSGKKGGKIKYYNTLRNLLIYHEGKYKLYSSNLFELALTEKGKY